jgi:histidinol dehydrogenase
MDLFSQAEHDELAQAILLCAPTRVPRRGARRRSSRLLPAMPRRDVIAASLAGRGALVKVREPRRGLRHRQPHRARAPRDLGADPQRWADRIRHAGAIFLGPWTVESLGDYCAGPNHVLPTMRTARFSSPLGVYDFQKRSSVIEVSRRARDARRDRLGAGARRGPAGARAQRRDADAEPRSDMTRTRRRNLT